MDPGIEYSPPSMSAGRPSSLPSSWRGARRGRHRVHPPCEGRHAAAAGGSENVRRAASPRGGLHAGGRRSAESPRRWATPRDRDVQIELLCGTLSALAAEDCFPGVARVLVQLERDRERLQRKVVQAVGRLEARGILSEMRRAADRLLLAHSLSAATADPAQAGTAVPRQHTPETIERFERHVLRQLDGLIEHQDSLANPEDRERHHAMRIAAKRLRYTLEISRLVHPGRLDAIVEAIKKVQTLLGDVHDCDVWLDHLDAFARAECKRIISMFRPRRPVPTFAPRH